MTAATTSHSSKLPSFLGDFIFLLLVRASARGLALTVDEPELIS
jgi:hypothetical protein